MSKASTCFCLYSTHVASTCLQSQPKQLPPTPACCLELNGHIRMQFVLLHTYLRQHPDRHTYSKRLSLSITLSHSDIHQWFQLGSGRTGEAEEAESGSDTEAMSWSQRPAAGGKSCARRRRRVRTSAGDASCSSQFRGVSKHRCGNKAAYGASPPPPLPGPLFPSAEWPQPN